MSIKEDHKQMYTSLQRVILKTKIQNLNLLIEMNTLLSYWKRIIQIHDISYPRIAKTFALLHIGQ